MTRISLLFVLLLSGSVAFAQAPIAEEPFPAEKVPVSEPAPVPAPVAATEPAPAAEPPATVSAFRQFTDSLTLGLGLTTFGEFFPVSSVKVPGTSMGQVSLLAGVRFTLGTQLPNWFRLMMVIEAGYASAGVRPGRGGDGVMEGAGVELTLERFKVKPFVRFMYDALVVPIRSSSEGALAFNAYFLSAGARYSIVELHLSIGKDFAGGISPGIGLSLGWTY